MIDSELNKTTYTMRKLSEGFLWKNLPPFK